MEDYLKFVEEQNTPEQKINRFEKVLIATKRAKDIYEKEENAVYQKSHKPTYRAILEYNTGKIEATYSKND